MRLDQALPQYPSLLMEGALGERLKREFFITPDEQVALAPLVYEEQSRQALLTLWMEYLEVAREHALPLMVTTPTRRVNRERMAASRYSASIIADNVELLNVLEKSARSPLLRGGLVGCKGDAYFATDVLTEADAQRFHSWQVELFAQAGVDYLFAGIMPALSEALGMARAIAATGLPYIISFMIRKNGRLIDGTPIADAIGAIDSAVDRPPVGYMVNCVHPTILRQALLQRCNAPGPVRDRMLGIQANTSPLEPDELDGAVHLFTSDADELAGEIAKLRDHFPLRIAGGCCGTDQSHLKAMAQLLGSAPKMRTI